MSTEPMYELPKVVGPAYLPLYPGYLYAAVPSTSNELVSKLDTSTY